MTKLAWNKFIQTYVKGHGIVFVFPEYKTGCSIKWSGEKLPSPNEIISSICKHRIKGDYSIHNIPKTAGTTVAVLINDISDASDIVSLFKAKKRSAPNLVPFKTEDNAVIYMKDHIQLAINLKLITPEPVKIQKGSQ